MMTPNLETTSKERGRELMTSGDMVRCNFNEIRANKSFEPAAAAVIDRLVSTLIPNEFAQEVTLTSTVLLCHFLDKSSSRHFRCEYVAATCIFFASEREGFPIEQSDLVDGLIGISVRAGIFTASIFDEMHTKLVLTQYLVKLSFGNTNPYEPPQFYLRRFAESSKNEDDGIEIRDLCRMAGCLATEACLHLNWTKRYNSPTIAYAALTFVNLAGGTELLQKKKDSIPTGLRFAFQFRTTDLSQIKKMIHEFAANVDKRYGVRGCRKDDVKPPTILLDEDTLTQTSSDNILKSKFVSPMHQREPSEKFIQKRAQRIFLAFFPDSQMSQNLDPISRLIHLGANPSQTGNMINQTTKCLLPSNQDSYQILPNSGFLSVNVQYKEKNKMVVSPNSKTAQLQNNLPVIAQSDNLTIPPPQSSMIPFATPSQTRIMHNQPTKSAISQSSEKMDIVDSSKNLSSFDFTATSVKSQKENTVLPLNPDRMQIQKNSSLMVPNTIIQKHCDNTPAAKPAKIAPKESDAKPVQSDAKPVESVSGKIGTLTAPPGIHSKSRTLINQTKKSAPVSSKIASNEPAQFDFVSGETKNSTSLPIKITVTNENVPQKSSTAGLTIRNNNIEKRDVQKTDGQILQMAIPNSKLTQDAAARGHKENEAKNRKRAMAMDDDSSSSSQRVSKKNRPDIAIYIPHRKNQN